MSDYAALIDGLRHWEQHRQSEAADAIERLVKERDAAVAGLGQVRLLRELDDKCLLSIRSTLVDAGVPVRDPATGQDAGTLGQVVRLIQERDDALADVKRLRDTDRRAERKP